MASRTRQDEGYVRIVTRLTWSKQREDWVRKQKRESEFIKECERVIGRMEGSSVDDILSQIQKLIERKI